MFEALIRQYKFNMEMTPYRFDIQSREKINNESIKEHVLKWHEMTI
jgi:hypothetical protein